MQLIILLQTKVIESMKMTRICLLKKDKCKAIYRAKRRYFKGLKTNVKLFNTASLNVIIILQFKNK